MCSTVTGCSKQPETVVPEVSSSYHSGPPGASVVWVKTETPALPCGSCWRVLWSVSPQLYKVVGQCMFGLAMLLIMAGIALCIWGYVGEAIRPFQIIGPVCIGLGVFIYVIGCVLCCRDSPMFGDAGSEDYIAEQKAREALDTLKQKHVVSRIYNDPELFEEFRIAAYEILEQASLFPEGEDVICNKYASRL